MKYLSVILLFALVFPFVAAAQKTVPIHPVDGEYIKEWLVLGPFFDNDLSLSTDFLAGVGGETKIHPQEGDTVGFDTGFDTPSATQPKSPLDPSRYSTQATADGKMLMWKRYKSKSDIIDLLDAVGRCDYATAYAFCVLRTDVAGDAQIYLGSDDGVAVWINGRQIHHNPVVRQFTLNEDVFEVNLKAGANCCLIKVSQVTRGWLFAMRATMLPVNRAVLSGVITDESGQPIPDADVRLEQDDSEIMQSQTDASGRYRLSIYPVRGTFDLLARTGGLVDWQLGIRLREGEHRQLSLMLKETASIEGTILMLDDTTPHVAMPVQAVIPGKDDALERPVALTLSDERGKYKLTNLKPGQYQIRCQVLGGYVYYGSSSISEVTGTHRDGNARASQSKIAGGPLEVLPGAALSNIDFRIAPFKKGTWKNYTYFVDGLRNNVVLAIHRDHDGVMWFGTKGGVSQYDGKEFLNLTTKDGLVNNSVNDIHSDSNGMLWFATEGGVSRYGFDGFDTQATQPKEGKKFKNFTTKDGLAHNSVNDIHSDPNGMLWFATEGGVSCYGFDGFDTQATQPKPQATQPKDGKEFKNFTTKDGLADNRVSSIYQTPDGVLWFGTKGGVSQYDVRLESGVHPAIQDKDGRTFVNLTTKDGLIHNWVNAIHSTSDGVMWFGTGDFWGDGGVSRYAGKTFVNFTRSLATSATDGLANNRVLAIHETPDGVLWFGTNIGVLRYDEKTFVNFFTQDGLTENVGTIYRDPDEVIWFGTGGGGVYRYDEKEFKNFTTKDGLASNYIRTTYCDPDGVLWFGTKGGASRYDGKEFKNFSTKDVWAIHGTSDGVLWFGTWGSGVSRYDGKEFKNFSTKDGLASNLIRAIYRDPDGVMWFGTSDDRGGGGVSCYDGEEFPPLAKGEGGIFSTKSNRARYIRTSALSLTFGVSSLGASNVERNGISLIHR